MNKPVVDPTGATLNRLQVFALDPVVQAMSTAYYWLSDRSQNYPVSTLQLTGTSSDGRKLELSLQFGDSPETKPVVVEVENRIQVSAGLRFEQLEMVLMVLRAKHPSMNLLYGQGESVSIIFNGQA
jgi:hypothetical protein